MKAKMFLVLLFIFCLSFLSTDLSSINFNTAEAASKLGDLNKFKTIALEVHSLVEKNDIVSAKKRIKDLEIVWDQAESGIKPRAGSDWREIDKAIDQALSALRENKPDVDLCRKTTTELIDIFNKFEK